MSPTEAAFEIGFPQKTRITIVECVLPIGHFVSSSFIILSNGRQLLRNRPVDRQCTGGG